MAKKTGRLAIPELIQKITGMKNGRDFSPYIDSIVFARYRRIKPMERIDFQFPLTVLVGRNGTGKSSALHALYGAPEGQSVANFWFGTAVDPVDVGAEVEVEEEDEQGKKKLTEEQKAAFWYSYRHDGQERQAIKQRVRREKAKAFADQENWEPTRPNETYGMKLLPGRGRHPQIQMTVRYLNLRYHLSAFDRCFNFWSEASRRNFRRSAKWKKLGGAKAPKVQDYIRVRAVRLKGVFERDGATRQGRHVMGHRPHPLTRAELEVVSRIVGKQYESGVLVEHRLYDDTWDYSVRFKTPDGNYTEANAGSGETAVVQIVKLFSEAEQNSLLLLDEPETSLHPGAQRELLHYILEQIYEKKLQVVISTHAPNMVRELPREAIKVLSAR